MPKAMKVAKVLAMKVVEKNVKATASLGNKGKSTKDKTKVKNKSQATVPKPRSPIKLTKENLEENLSEGSPKGIKTKGIKKDSKITKKKLEVHDPGSMTLEEKMQILGKSNEPQVLAQTLLTKLDRSKLWNKANCKAKHDPELKKMQDAAKTKHDKGLLTLAINIDPKKGPVFEGMTKTIKCIDMQMKKEVWMTWDELEKAKGNEAATAWLDSGRVTWRFDAASGIYEYMDTCNVERHKVVSNEKRKTVTQSDHELKVSLQDDVDSIEKMLEDHTNCLLNNCGQ